MGKLLRDPSTCPALHHVDNTSQRLIHLLVIHVDTRSTQCRHGDCSVTVAGGGGQAGKLVVLPSAVQCTLSNCSLGSILKASYPLLSDVNQSPQHSRGYALL